MQGILLNTIETNSSGMVYFFHKFALKAASLSKEKYIHTGKQRYKIVEETLSSMDFCKTSTEKENRRGDFFYYRYNTHFF